MRDDDYAKNSHFLTYTFLFRKVGRMYFLNLGVNGLKLVVGISGSLLVDLSTELDILATIDQFISKSNLETAPTRLERNYQRAEKANSCD